MDWKSVVGDVLSITSKVLPLILDGVGEDKADDVALGQVVFFRDSEGHLCAGNPTTEDVQMMWTSSTPDVFLSEAQPILSMNKVPVASFFDDFPAGQISVAPLDSGSTENWGWKDIFYSIKNVIHTGIPITVTGNVTVTVDNSVIKLVVVSGATIAGTYFMIRLTDWLFTTGQQQGNMPEPEENGENKDTYTYVIDVPKGIDLSKPIQELTLRFSLPNEYYQEIMKEKLERQIPMDELDKRILGLI